MKPLSLRLSCLAVAATLAGATTYAAVPAAPAPKPPAPGPVVQAMSAALAEISTASSAALLPHQRLDALLQFRHTPETAAKLAKIYGDTVPWTLTRLPAGAGAYNYRATVSPLHFKDTDGSSVDWAAAVLDIAVGADDNTVTADGRWPTLTAADKTMRISVRDARTTVHQSRSVDKLWFGDGKFDIAAVQFEPAKGGPSFSVDGIHAESSVIDQHPGVEMRYQFGARRLGVGGLGLSGGDGIDNFRIVTRVTSIDRQSLLALQALNEAGTLPVNPALAPKDRHQALLPILQTFARGAIRSGTALDIDALSATYHGQTLQATGHVGLEGATETDVDNPAMLLKKIAARFTAKAPLALLREVATTMAGIQIRANNKADKGEPDARAVAQLAASLNDLFLGKLMSSGYVRLEGDMLVSDIEYSSAGGGLRINGKSVALPTPPAVATASAQMMQTRRIDARCTLPDYPLDIVKADAPLSLTMRLLVQADGKVRNVTLSKPSTRPDYDQAVLTAAARCVYIPALRNGQPIDTPAVWKVVREAGTSHP